MKAADKLGDYLKEVEGVEAGRAVPIGTPIVARLDGRSFHTFTKGLKRPYDERLSKLMVHTTISLVQELHARVGYTQSDEISLVWYYPEGSPSEYPFSGRLQKLCSVLASCATAHFIRGLDLLIPEKRNLIPMFDCRVWPTSRDDAVSTFKWREADARKNAVSMAASAHFSHKDLQDVGTAHRIAMLREVGIDFNAMPGFFKHGTYVYRHKTTEPLDAATLEKIPAHCRPTDNLVTRNVVKGGEVSKLDALTNPAGFLLDGQDPVYKEAVV